MASFDDVNRIVNTPLGSTGEIDPFVQKPAIPDSPNTDPVHVLGMEDIYAREMDKALSNSGLGALDLALAAKGVLAGGILEVLQTEYNDDLAHGEAPLNPNSLFNTLASAPIDWKSVALAAGVYALASGSRRARRPYTVLDDMKKTISVAQAADAEIVPHTEATYRKFRIMRRTKQFAGTVAATGAAYGAGRYLPLEADMIGGMAATAVGALRASGAQRRFIRRYAQ